MDATPVEQFIETKDIRLLHFDQPCPWVHQMPNGQVIHEAPRVSIHKDALAVPAGSTPRPYRLIGGLLSRNEDLIPEIAVERGPTEDVYAGIPIDQNRKLRALTHSGPALICGWHFSHFGHFMTETLSSLWPATMFDSRIPRVFFAPFGKKSFSDSEATILAALGFSGANTLIVRDYLKLPLAAVPTPLFRPRKHVYEFMGDFLAQLGRSLVRSARPSKLRKVYISRRALTRPTRLVANEADVELLLRRAGYSVVYPEILTLAEQIAVLRDADVVVGFTGSYFHLAPLARPNGLRVCLSEPTINGNFVLTDCLSSGSARYLNCMERSPADETPTVRCNLDRTADALASLKLV